MNRSERNRRYYLKHRDERRDKHRVYGIKYRSTLRGKFSSWKKSAKERGIKWDLTYESVARLSFKCFYTDVMLTLKANEWNSVSMDRIDSKLGYTPSNIVLCCAMINYMKQDSSYDNFVKACQLVVKFHDQIN